MWPAKPPSTRSSRPAPPANWAVGVADATSGGQAGRSETLYLELRRGNETLDPAEWFVLNPIVEPQQD